MVEADGSGQEHRAPTVNDVAARAGVSRQTVSNVLNAPERVRGSTRERVEEAIDELGYRPHRNARNLKNRSSRLIGYRVRAATEGRINAVLDRFLHALSDTAHREGYNILLFTADDGEEVAMLDELVATATVDGFIVSGTTYADPRVRHLHDRGVPFASFGRTDHPWPHSWVDVDNVAGMRMAVEHLVAGGRRRIAYLGWPDGAIAMDDRRAGFEQGMADAGLPLTADLDARGPDDERTGREAAARWFRLPSPPDAIVAGTDLLATGVLLGARELGISVGEDVAVVGFDDTPTAPFLWPPLSSVRQPIEEIAVHVLRLLVARIADAAPQPDGVLVPPRLVIRNSSRERNAA